MKLNESLKTLLVAPNNLPRRMLCTLESMDSTTRCHSNVKGG